MSDLVKREERDGWVQLTLNRPDKLNSLNVEMFAQLRTHCEVLAKPDDVGCAVIRGPDMEERTSAFQKT